MRSWKTHPFVMLPRRWVEEGSHKVLQQLRENQGHPPPPCSPQCWEVVGTWGTPMLAVEQKLVPSGSIMNYFL
jgi:hypothetical protein